MWMIFHIPKKIITVITSIVFPSYCYICHREGTALCDVCLSSRAYAYDTPSPCITPLYSFKDPDIKKIIHAIKYFHRKDLIKPLASHLAKEIHRDTLANTIIIPIPMPLIRKYIRGYNQVEVLSHLIGKELLLPVATNILVRNEKKKRLRQVQTHSRSERLKNQHNAFVVQKSLQGITVILIDDVTTTGATLLEARKILLASGAVRVDAYTLAH
jgi:ComF family protein